MSDDWEAKRREEGLTGQQLADALSQATGHSVSPRTLYDYAHGHLPKAAATFRLLDAWARGDATLRAGQFSAVDPAERQATALAATRKLAQQILTLTDDARLIGLLAGDSSDSDAGADSTDRVSPGYRIPRTLNDRIKRAYAAAYAVNPKRFPSLNAFVTDLLHRAIPDDPA